MLSELLLIRAKVLDESNLSLNGNLERQAAERIEKLQKQIEDDNNYFLEGIRADAKRVGINTDGLIGLAIVNTMADKIIKLEGENNGGRSDTGTRTR